MPVIIPSEQGNTPLSLAQWEAIVRAHFRASVSATLSSDTLTIPGSGRYKVLPQSGTSDQLTTIVLTGENLEGTWIELRPETIGHVITVVNAGNLHLFGTANWEMPSIFSTIQLRHYGSGVWAQCGGYNYVRA